MPPKGKAKAAAAAAPVGPFDLGGATAEAEPPAKGTPLLSSPRGGGRYGER